MKRASLLLLAIAACGSPASAERTAQIEQAITNDQVSLQDFSNSCNIGPCAQWAGQICLWTDIDGEVCKPYAIPHDGIEYGYFAVDSAATELWIWSVVQGTHGNGDGWYRDIQCGPQSFINPQTGAYEVSIYRTHTRTTYLYECQIQAVD